jgi:hypothetical protein
MEQRGGQNDGHGGRRWNDNSGGHNVGSVGADHNEGGQGTEMAGEGNVAAGDCGWCSAWSWIWLQSILSLTTWGAGIVYLFYLCSRQPTG